MPPCDPVPFRRRCGVNLALLGLVLVVVASALVSPAVAETLTIGTISRSPVAEMKTFRPFASYLENALESDGIDQVKIVIAPDENDLAQKHKDGEIDLYIDSSITAMMISQRTGSTFIARRWKKNRPKYRSVIFVAQDSEITSLDDLKGRRIAFEEPFSTSGYLLPVLTLRVGGHQLKHLFSTRSELEPDVTGFVLAYDNKAQVSWVEEGRVDAAAMSEGDFEEYSKTALTPLRVVARSPYVPYHVVTARPGFDPVLAERVQTVLKSIHETPEGKTMLFEFERTAKFDDIPEDLMENVMSFAPYIENLLSE